MPLSKLHSPKNASKVIVLLRDDEALDDLKDTLASRYVVSTGVLFWQSFDMVTAERAFDLLYLNP